GSISYWGKIGYSCTRSSRKCRWTKLFLLIKQEASIMLIHPVIQKLQQLKLYSMAKNLKEQGEQAGLETLSFEERLSLLVDIEMSVRDSRRLQARLRKAKLKHEACVEDIDY